MFTATVLWATVYDTMYAMVDRQDDIALGLKSTAILFGDADRTIIAVLQLMVLVCLVMIGYQVKLGMIYYTGVAVGGALFVYQLRLIRFREREDCFRAFQNNNWFGMAVFLGILLDYVAA
jgi:4-hydroxybenzoate polyprenyltransferase